MMSQRLLVQPEAIIGTLFALVLGRWLYNYLRVRLEVLGLPTTHSLFELFESGIRSKLPQTPFVSPVASLSLQKPFEKYANAKTDLLAFTQATTPYAVYATANPSVAASISNKPAKYVKPVRMFRYQAINRFGRQIVSAQNGEEHKRHKGVVRACFGKEIMETGWTTMVDAYQVMCREEGLENGGILKDVKEVLAKVTLLVIGSASFGVQFPYNSSTSEDALMPFSDAIQLVETSMIFQLPLPLWLMTWSPFPYLRRCAKAQRSMVKHINEMIASRRKQTTALQATLSADEQVLTQRDILGALVASQIQVEEGKKKNTAGLTADEIFGNAFIFIVAGHTTTAHTLTFALALMALYPQTQEDIVQELASVCGDEYPTYRHMSKLPLTLATMYEALRL
ncbi:cytochrome P450 [Kockovaella imperatae]|uniref:Cytochrome P450 n=1 Tax=Kockovaella imperatae TaxID=4999 RepID=A0A1Y1UJQ2_9TREE|nr:cytochrome P450 [Kockovaella imperatae]ORX37696.1 cytochrome P450 [Kockovaella imperatae]